MTADLGPRTSDFGLVQCTGIAKAFAGVPALTGVDLTIRAGEVHGLLGENGAGKSTLMHILFGLLRPDAGTIAVDGKPVRLASPLHARRIGIGMVHQHLTLAPSLTAFENLALAVGDGLRPVDRRGLGGRARAVAAGLGWELPWDEPAGRLAVGTQQRLEIVKALVGGGRVLVLDEPTAVLAPQEASELLTALRGLAARGTAVVFISHKLHEIEAACDVVSVLRRGRLVFHGPQAGVSRERLTALMVGTAPPAGGRTPAPAPATAPIRLQFHGISGSSGSQRLAGADLAVRAGEIVGIAGVDGNGQGALVDLALGLVMPTAGRLVRDGDLGQRTLALIPGDRQHEGLVPELSVRENLLLKAGGTAPFAWRGWLRPALWQRRARRLIPRFAIRTATAALPVAALSGGNQQKVVVARELCGRPRLVVAVNPTRGLDVAAAAAVLERLVAARDAGAAVLLVHPDLDELLSIADRVLVCCGGRLIDSGWPAANRARIGRLMLGVEA